VLHYVARPPTPLLANLVDYLWASQGAPPQAKERVVPTGTLELAFGLVDGVGRIYDPDGRCQSLTSGAMVSGAYRRPFTFDTSDQASAVGVHFKPGCASVLLGVPASELVDQHVDLEALWGRRAHELRDRLCRAATTEERFSLLEAELLSRLGERRAHPIVAYALGVLVRPDARVAAIAKETRVSPRRLIELFTGAVGLTPKRFGRIVRFQRATALARRSAVDWTRIAHECGYYDQAHLIRDCRELADLTPSQLVRASVHVKEQHQLAVPER
jgi:AraC-like DNA-binding protein